MMVKNAIEGGNYNSDTFQNISSVVLLYHKLKATVHVPGEMMVAWVALEH